MKTKLFLVLLSIVMSFQSCVVYQKAPVSIENIDLDQKAKVVNESGDEYRFKHIEEKDGGYYGSRRGQLLKIDVDKNKIYPISKSKTIAANVGGLLAPPALLLLIFILTFDLGPVIK